MTLVSNPAKEFDVSPSTQPTAGLDVRLLSGSIGAVVENANLKGASLAATAVQLRRLVTAHQVVFLPGQHLEERDFTALAQQFGSLSVHPLRTVIGRPQTVSVIEDSPSRPPAGFPWHTDLSWLATPPRFGFLHALEIPPQGGDTMWASLTAAYTNLSPAIQQLCSGLRAVHGIDPSFRNSVVRNHGEEVAARLDAANPPIAHPLVRTHPDTGEPALWLSPLYVSYIQDLTPSESIMLLTHLEAVANDPNIAVRWHWTEGDIAIWDESVTVHRALIDHHPASRRMRRCTTEGSQPIGF